MNKQDVIDIVMECIIKKPRYWPIKGYQKKVILANPKVLQNVNVLFNVSCGTITVDEGTFAGHDVSLITGTHTANKKIPERYKSPKSGNDIVIGKGVWLGSSSTVLGPCTIGDHAVVAAGALVAPNTIIKEGEIWGGVPAKLIKRIKL